MSEKKIELYRVRDFGQKLNATVEFIRANFKGFYLSLLFIAAPSAILMGLAMQQILSFTTSMASNPSANSLENLPSLFTGYAVMMVVSILGSLMLTLTVFSYMELYRKSENSEFSTSDVLRNALSRFGQAFLLTILIFITVFVSVFFFIIPALYFGIVLSLALPIMFFDKVDAIEAYKRSFALIKEKWWSTFGIIFIAWLIAYAVTLIFSIPFYAIYIFEIVGMMDEINSDPSAIGNIFSSWYMVIATAILYIGGYLTYSIPIVAIAFQYFNLSERKNAPGLISKIEDFENIQ